MKKYKKYEYCNGDKEKWRELSNECKRLAGYRCDRCGCKGKEIGGTKQLEAHHKKPKSKGGRDKLSNLRCLCEECHHNFAGHDHLKDTDKNDADGYQSKLLAGKSSIKKSEIVNIKKKVKKKIVRVVGSDVSEW